MESNVKLIDTLISTVRTRGYFGGMLRYKISVYLTRYLIKRSRPSLRRSSPFGSSFMSQGIVYRWKKTLQEDGKLARDDERHYKEINSDVGAGVRGIGPIFIPWKKYDGDIICFVPT